MSEHTRHPLALITNVSLLSAQLRFGGPEKGRLCTSKNVRELRPLQAGLSGSGWGIAGQAMRAATGGERMRWCVTAAGEQAHVPLRFFQRSLASFGGQRLGNWPMRR
jgi:hypothetical protein